MKLYFTVRFGHPESPDGPDGEDTNFLVRASSFLEAATITDKFLANAPTTSPSSKRPVDSRCHRVIELGTDGSSESQAAIVHGPWIRFCSMSVKGCPAWHRDGIYTEWVTEEEIWGDRQV